MRLPGSRPSKAVAAAIAMLVLAVAVPAQAALTNGNFETGDFSGWTVRIKANSGGNWFVYTGTSSPYGGTVAAPPEGSDAAITDAINPGAQVLFQKIHVTAQNDAVHLWVYYSNGSVTFCSPKSFRFGNSAPCNQQYRIDILSSGARPFSTSVLKPLFQTKPGDPQTLAPTEKVFSLKRFIGRTVMLRFAEVDNQDAFRASVDDVRLVHV